MEVIAKLNNLRISPRKVRLVADLIRGKSTDEAQAVLNFTVKKSTLPLIKLLNQAILNAKNNLELSPDNLYISQIIVNEGPKLKRWRPRSRGQAYEIQKKTSHIVITLEERVKGKKVKKSKKEKTEKIEKTESNQAQSVGLLKNNKAFKKPKTKEDDLKQVKPGVEKVSKKIFRRKAF